jgi:hypothetical protein
MLPSHLDVRAEIKEQGKEYILAHCRCMRGTCMNKNLQNRVALHDQCRKGFSWGTKEPGSSKILEAHRKSLVKITSFVTYFKEGIEN